MRLGPITIDMGAVLVCDCPCCWDSSRVPEIVWRLRATRWLTVAWLTLNGWQVTGDGKLLCQECVADGCDAE